MPLPSVKPEQTAVARAAAVGIGVAAAVFALSYADGGFAPTTRSYAGIAAWWLLGAGAAIGIASARTGINRLAVVALGLLAAFAVWILISVNWATDAERAFAQFNQVSLYVAVLAIAIVLARLVPASWVVGGVALAVSAIAVIALVSSCFPSTFGLQPGQTILPALTARLSFPLGYWNGLGIEVALAYPLLLAIMTSRRSRVASAVAALPLPVLAAVMYLTSSRGAFVAAALGVVAYVVLTPRRWAALAALVVAGVGRRSCGRGARAQEGTRRRPDEHRARRASGPPRGAPDRDRLRRHGARLGRTRRAREARALRRPRVVGVAVVVAVVGLFLVAVVASHPVRKFEQFKNNSLSAGTQGTPTTSHLFEQLRQRALAVLECGGLRVPGPSTQRRRRRFLGGLVAPARLAASTERVRALAVPRGARRAGDRRPAAHRRRGRRRGRGRGSVGAFCCRAVRSPRPLRAASHSSGPPRTTGSGSWLV